MLFVYLILAVIALIYLWIKKRYSFWNERGFLNPPSEVPFGSVKGFGQTRNPCEIMHEIYLKYKGKASAVGIYIFLEPVVLPIDPELYKNIFVRDFATFHDRGFYYNKEVDPLSAK
jgi:cytochrome P450 family 6